MAFNCQRCVCVCTVQWMARDFQVIHLPGTTQVHGHASNCDPNRHFTRLLSCSLSILTCTFFLSFSFSTFCDRLPPLEIQTWQLITCRMRFIRISCCNFALIHAPTLSFSHSFADLWHSICVLTIAQREFRILFIFSRTIFDTIKIRREWKENKFRGFHSTFNLSQINFQSQNRQKNREMLVLEGWTGWQINCNLIKTNCSFITLFARSKNRPNNYDRIFVPMPVLNAHLGTEKLYVSVRLIDVICFAYENCRLSDGIEN